jgi:hypothetical protein
MIRTGDFVNFSRLLSCHSFADPYTYLEDHLRDGVLQARVDGLALRVKGLVSGVAGFDFPTEGYLSFPLA